MAYYIPLAFLMNHFFAYTLFLVAMASNVKAQDKQSFEGTIVYRIDVQSKMPNISTADLQKMYGRQMVLSIQRNNYCMAYSGLDLKKVTYLGVTNKQYTLRNGIDTLFVTSCAEEKRQLVSSVVTPETTIILGHKCRTLINNLGATQNHYYFDSSIYLAPNNFANHNFGYFNVYCKKAQSPYLKYVYNGTSFSFTYTAVSIQEQKLSSTIFQFPKLTQTAF